MGVVILVIVNRKKLNEIESYKNPVAGRGHEPNHRERWVAAKSYSKPSLGIPPARLSASEFKRLPEWRQGLRCFCAKPCARPLAGTSSMTSAKR